MPARLKRACRKHGCAGTTTHRSGYCDRHLAENSNWDQWQQGKGNTTQRGYGGSWPKIRQRILRRDRHLCQSCLQKGIVKEGKHVDHIIPKAQGGTNADSNLQTLCVACHRRKTATERTSGKGRGA